MVLMAGFKLCRDAQGMGGEPRSENCPQTGSYFRWQDLPR